MVCVNHPCESCKNFYGRLDNGHFGCAAFPDGWPKTFLSKMFNENMDVRTLKECANGYKYTPKEK